MMLTRGGPSTRRETLPSATLSTINPTRSDMQLQRSLRGNRIATNRLSHCTSLKNVVCNVVSGSPAEAEMWQWQQQRYIPQDTDRNRRRRESVKPYTVYQNMYSVNFRRQSLP